MIPCASKIRVLARAPKYLQTDFVKVTVYNLKFLKSDDSCNDNSRDVITTTPVQAVHHCHGSHHAHLIFLMGSFNLSCGPGSKTFERSQVWICDFLLVKIGSSGFIRNNAAAHQDDSAGVIKGSHSCCLLLSIPSCCFSLPLYGSMSKVRPGSAACRALLLLLLAHTGVA